MRGVEARPGRTAADDGMHRLLHDLRQHVATGLLLFEDGDELAVDDLRSRMSTGRMLFGQLSAIVSAAGGEPGDSEVVDVGAVTDETVTVFRHGHPTLTVCATYEEGLESRLDRTSLHRALSNVLENAARASQPGGRVTVEVWGERSHVLVEVGDEGQGFGQGPRGTGQGMRTVSDLVRAAQGRLLIHSGPDVGTQVRIVLPRVGAGNAS